MKTFQRNIAKLLAFKCKLFEKLSQVVFIQFVNKTFPVDKFRFWFTLISGVFIRHYKTLMKLTHFSTYQVTKECVRFNYKIPTLNMYWNCMRKSHMYEKKKSLDVSQKTLKANRRNYRSSAICCDLTEQIVDQINASPWYTAHLKLSNMSR